MPLQAIRQFIYNAAMTLPQTPSAPSIKVIPASIEQEPILANLLELYIYDFSEFFDLKLGAEGRFGYKQLRLYWEEPDRYPFLIMVDGDWAGFAFVRRGSQISGDKGIWDMAEFFVLRGYRRLGVGMKVAHTLWTQFPGEWEVRVIDRNERAKEFWRQAVSEFLGLAVDSTAYDKNGEGWRLFTFESRRDA
jgi:predicted acetyltransferase